MSLKKAMQLADEGNYKEAYETLLIHISPPVGTDWIKDFNNLFPTAGEIEDEVGKPMMYSPRQSITQVMSRMKTFMSKYMPKEFPMISAVDRPDMIMKATRLYLHERQIDNWEFIKKSTKFIHDTNGSVLMEYLRKVVEEKPVSKERVQKW